jgi:hypothetical protein
MISNKLTIKRVFSIIKDAFHSKSPIYILGRWGLHTKDKVNMKADFANEDHCGTCAHFVTRDKKQ